MNLICREYLEKACGMAESAGHIFPTMAACESALESGYGMSGLTKSANNCFGIKQHHPPIYETFTLPTREYINGEWVMVNADFVKYPSLLECFKDRMDTLKRLASKYPNYAGALAASDPIAYVTYVSRTWSTDPDRARKVISIFYDYLS